jgi:hypothetical protein
MVNMDFQPIIQESNLRNSVLPTQVERPEMSGFKVVSHEPDLHISRYSIDGRTPEITDHISNRTFKIIDGVGKLLTSRGLVKLRQGTETEVYRGTPYVIEGCLSLSVEIRPMPFREFVTFNGEKLPAPNRRELKKIFGQTLSQKAMQRLVDSVPIPSERYLQILTILDELPRLQDNEPI